MRLVHKKLVVEMQNTLKIFNLTLTSSGDLKDSLTFENPLYKSAMKFAKNKSFVRIPPFITYYKYDNRNKSIEIPIGYDLSLLKSDYIVKDYRITAPAHLPKFKLGLREDQKEARESFIKKNKGTDINGVVVLPTGKGKTILGLNLVSYYKQKTLVIVHKDDLVVGWKNDIKLCFGDDFKSGLIKAKSRDIQDITIATIQTLNRLSPDEIEKLSDTFGMVILDECHHCPASSYDFLTYLKPKIRLGLTATPERSDGLKELINLHFGGFAYVYENSGNEEDILPVKVYLKDTGIFFDPVYYLKGGKYYPALGSEKLNYTGVPLSGNLFRYSEIPYDEKPRLNFVGDDGLDNAIVSYPEYLYMVCNDIVREYKQGSNCVVFFTQKQHIDLYCAYLLNLDIDEDTIQLYYGDSKLSSQEIMQNAESGKKRITLTTYAKGTEGTNVKAWDTCFLVSSLNNGKNVEQAVGRVRRVKEGKRKYAKVYDYYSPDIVILHKHLKTRTKRYRDLGFEILGDTPVKSVQFSIGYRR